MEPPPCTQSKGSFLLPVEQILPGHPDVAEGELGVVDPVEPHLVAHVLHEHAGKDFQLVVSRDMQN